MSASTQPKEPTPGRRTLAGVVGTVVAASLLTGLSVWQVGLHTSSNSQPAGPAPIQRAVTGPAAPSALALSPTSVTANQTANASLAVVLAGSDERARWVEQAVDATDELRHQFGSEPLQWQVSQGDAAAEQGIVADENGQRRLLHLPEITVEDLR